MKMLGYRESSRLSSPSSLICKRNTCPPRGPLATMSTAAEGQRQYVTRWYGLGGEESSSTAIIQALSPVGETVPSRRHNQTDSESGKEVTRLSPKRCRSRLLFFRLNIAFWRCSEVSYASAGRHFHKAIGWLMTRSTMLPWPKRISGRYSRRLKWATKSCSLSEN